MLKTRSLTLFPAISAFVLVLGSILGSAGFLAAQGIPLGSAAPPLAPHAASELAPPTVESGREILLGDAQLSLIQNTLIASPMPGIVEAVTVKEGDRVRVGQAMVRLNADQVATELRAAQAAYEAAQMKAGNDVDARYAKRTLEVRQRELQQNREANEGFAGAISDTEIAKLELVVDQSQLAIEQAEHDLQVAAAAAREKEAAVEIIQARLNKHSIAAAVTGTVVEVAVEAGEWIEAGKPVVRLITVDPIRAECFVNAQEQGANLVGREVQFTFTGKKAQVLRGVVVFVSPEVHPVTGQARLWATLKNPQKIARAGMQGTLVVKASQ